MQPQMIFEKELETLYNTVEGKVAGPSRTFLTISKTLLIEFCCGDTLLTYPFSKGSLLIVTPLFSTTSILILFVKGCPCCSSCKILCTASNFELGAPSASARRTSTLACKI